MPPQESTTKKGGRGFASMDREKQRQISSQGGKAAHEKGTAHEFTSEEARAAGRRGGEVVSRNREHMARIGAEGGRARGQSQKKAQAKETSGVQNSENRKAGDRSSEE